ncbi:MAG TPA: glycosyltransferase [Actinomycetota bacterium]|nr:glycosyltransferase [Actinomycetota bacterium]
MRIVVFAYACEPGKGSEPGAGWALAQMIASFADVHVITRSNNAAAVEDAHSHLSTRDRMSFSFVEGPAWSRRLKKGQRGIRLYHSLWQRAALKEARRLHERGPFDAAWHITIANAWLGSAGGRLGIPFVFGPVGGGVTAPWRIVRALGWRAVAFEVARITTRMMWRTFNPLARNALKRATLVIAQNKETRDWLPRRYHPKTVIFQNAVMEGPAPTPKTRSHSHPIACFAGRLNTWKGAAIAIRAIAATPDWHLVLLGEGPERERLWALADELDVVDRVQLRGRVSHPELFRVMSEEADAFLFPSLHDDSALAVAEAVACGLPVVCLDIGGTPVIAGERGIAVDPHGSPKSVVKDLAAALEKVRSWTHVSTEAERVSLGSRAGALRTLVAYHFGLDP